MSTFTALLNKTLVVTGRTQTGEDGGGQPIWDDVEKGTVRGRVESLAGTRDGAEVVNDANLNPIISDFRAFIEVPSGFDVVERDTVTDDTGAYEVLSVGPQDGRFTTHHLLLRLRRIA